MLALLAWFVSVSEGFVVESSGCDSLRVRTDSEDSFVECLSPECEIVTPVFGTDSGHATGLSDTRCFTMPHATRSLRLMPCAAAIVHTEEEDPGPRVSWNTGDFEILYHEIEDDAGFAKYVNPPPQPYRFRSTPIWDRDQREEMKQDECWRVMFAKWKP